MIVYLLTVGYDVAIYRANLGLLYSEVIITKCAKRSYYKLKTKIKIYTQNTMLCSFVDYNIDVGTGGTREVPLFM